MQFGSIEDWKEHGELHSLVEAAQAERTSLLLEAQQRQEMREKVLSEMDIRRRIKVAVRSHRRETLASVRLHVAVCSIVTEGT